MTLAVRMRLAAETLAVLAAHDEGDTADLAELARTLTDWSDKVETLLAEQRRDQDELTALRALRREHIEAKDQLRRALQRLGIA